MVFPAERNGELEALRQSLIAPTLPQLFNAAERICNPEMGSQWSGPIQRVAVLGSLTMDFAARAMAGAIFREGVLPILFNAPYGSYVQEILNPKSTFSSFGADVAVLMPDRRDLARALSPGASEDDVREAVASSVELFGALWQRLNAAGCTIVQSLIVPPRAGRRGVADRFLPASEANQIAQLNEALLARGQGTVHWIETDRLAAEIGLNRWAPERFFYNAKLPFDPQFTPQFMEYFAAAWRGANARTKKVLVLDLDNTLWGGVIGDDGVENIQLGPETPAGEAFAAFGTYVKQLAERGVILAVASKNDPKIAATGLEHVHSVLKLQDFACFECSWGDKATSLRRIAKALNVGIESLVFVDDNPAECALVRKLLPSVSVVELGSDPSAFISKVESGHWFDLQHYTRDDFARSTSYAARRRAEESREQSVDIGSYLAGLAMTGGLQPASESDLQRVAQLEQKTNQFNVTTRRYDEATIRALAARDDVALLAFNLQDRYGDHGLVSTLIGLHEGATFRIDSWLMSCRIFSRTAEEFIMARVIARARALGASKIVAEYVPTEKNGIVAGLFGRLGFSSDDRQGRLWHLNIAADAPLAELVTHIADRSASGE